MRKTKKVNKKFKKFVKEWIFNYSKCIDSPWHMGDISYMSEDKTDMGYITLADTTINSSYLTADYNIYPSLEKLWKRDPELAKAALAHEVAHIVTHKLHELSICAYKNEEEVKEAWESTTEIVGRLIFKKNEKNTP